MRISKMNLWIVVLLLPLISIEILGINSEGKQDDDSAKIDKRVARVKFLRGNVQIKRKDGKQSERATLNLPIIAGDEIYAEENARIEIQFDNYSHIRLDENSGLKISKLSENQISVDISEGSLILSVTKFETGKDVFEINAPQTSISVEKKGNYRIDAGDKYNKEVRIAVSDGGKSRIYSEDSSFTLQDKSRARFYLGGEYAGQWETLSASRYLDSFDRWSLNRSKGIANSLDNAHYDKYYDDTIYGADDLNNNGNWSDSDDYGQVWTPNKTALANYPNWSPYRYGKWRWLPSYGWTWVNDEPWGFSTYHYGRWVYINGSWGWSPYSQNRQQKRKQRSKWRPALVVISFIADNICWYPLPYDSAYDDYNSRYERRRRRRRRNRRKQHKNRERRSHLRSVPANSVMSVSERSFGRGRKTYSKSSLKVAQRALSQKDRWNDTKYSLPAYDDIDNEISNKIRVRDSQRAKFNRRVKTGVPKRNIRRSAKRQTPTRIINRRASKNTFDPEVENPKSLNGKPVSKRRNNTRVFNSRTKTTSRRPVPSKRRQTNAPNKIRRPKTVRQIGKQKAAQETELELQNADIKRLPKNINRRVRKSRPQIRKKVNNSPTRRNTKPRNAAPRAIRRNNRYQNRKTRPESIVEPKTRRVVPRKARPKPQRRIKPQRTRKPSPKQAARPKPRKPKPAPQRKSPPPKKRVRKQIRPKPKRKSAPKPKPSRRNSPAKGRKVDPNDVDN